MNNFKNLLIATLTGLLALSLFSQPAQSAPKTYYALKLAEYSACINALNSGIDRSGFYPENTPLTQVFKNMTTCSKLRP